MSRRKQSNPKPLLKSDCQESVDEMTVERDNKDFCSSDLIDEAPSGGDIVDNSEQFSSDSMQDDGSPPPPSTTATITSPQSASKNSLIVTDLTTNKTHSMATAITISAPATTLITETTKILSSSSSTIPATTTTTPTTLGTTGKNDIKDTITITPTPTITAATLPVPKLRLNVSLASDPALKPDAKDIKIIQDDDDDDDDNDYDNSPSNDISSYSKNKNSDENGDEDEVMISCNTNIGNSTTTNSNGSNNNNNNGNTVISGQIVTKPPSANVEVTHRLKVFMCHPCGIGFSSHSTLDAHQKYYCSHRQEIDDDIPSNNVLMSVATTATADKSSTGEPLAKSIKTGKQYACTQCSYSADKKVSLNRHMRMHQSSPAPSSNTSNGEETSSQQIDRYCSECDIRFSNVKTYRAHKQHYCSSRRTEGQTPPKPDSKKSGSISPQGRSKTPTSVAPPQPFLALPTNPILIIPYSVVRAASLLPGPLTSVTSGVANPDATCFSFENGALHPVATALNTQILTESSTTRIPTSQCSSNPVAPLLSEKNLRNTNNISKQTSKKEGSSRETIPLDLSVRKSPISFQRSPLDIMMTSIGLSSTDENKLDIEAMMEGKENLSIMGGGKLTPEQIVCSPSLPSSPSMSPSPKRKTSPRINAISTSPGPGPGPGPNCLETGLTNIRPLLSADLSIKLAEANAIPSLLSKQQIELALKLANKPNESSSVAAAAVAAAAGVATPSMLSLPPGNAISVVPSIPNVQPQIYVKQGVSKCKECNIVFCKFENYLAHKQHYCSARNQEESDVKVTTPPTTGTTTDSGPPSIAYHQLICAACGIKYTSLDNLRAHQTFYCPKGSELSGSSGGNSGGSGTSVTAASTTMSTISGAGSQTSTGKEKCSKCKVIHDSSKSCPISSTQGSYKCPVCGIISLNATDSRKHLETHGSVKAFRCSICRYKGNTLRGMRTHIRMHFDKKSADFNEENYMSCILEEDGVEISSTTAMNQDQNSQQQLFNCEICNYSSSYKGNVIRHMKLVHSQQGIRTPSTSPEIGEGDEPLTQNGETNKVRSKDSVAVKMEPIEMKNTEKDMNATTKIEGISMKIKIEPKDIHDVEMNTISPATSIGSNSIGGGGGTVAASGFSSLLQLPPSSNKNTLTSIAAKPQLSVEANTTSLENLLGTQQIISSSASSNNSDGINGGTKYCQNCDIKFNYLNTYIAHKQFYCKNNNNKQQQQQQQRTDIKTPSPVSVVLQSSSSTLGNSNKNKENLETVL